MTRHVFISAVANPYPRWLAAFPRLVLRKTVRDYLKHGNNASDLCWLDATHLSMEQQLGFVKLLMQANRKAVVLSNAPNDDQAQQLLFAGARGYCHAQAMPEQLRDVATVVGSGNYWVPPSLVEKLVLTAVQLGLPAVPKPADALAALTEREREVAQHIGRGASNREIAEALDITERTVKSHLTTIFEKLELRDRVQLALIVHGLPLH
jgi:DNA-binding NarL/FixJ family response regulator